MHEKGLFGSAANHYLSALYHESVKQGINIKRLLDFAGIDHDLIDKPNQRVPTERLAKLQKLAWHILKDESMGLFSSTKCLPIGTYYMMGKLTVQQSTLKKALELGAQFYNLITQSTFITIKSDEKNTEFSINITEPELDTEHLFAEITLLAWHRYASWLIADSIPLIETRFNYPTPAHASEYAYLFPGIHKFDCDSLSLVFPSQYLTRPIKQNEALLKSFMHNCPLELFRQYKSDYSVSAEIKRILNNAIGFRNISVEDISLTLYMSTRTIMRRLKEEGTSFQQLKDVVRRDLSITLLTLHSLPIKDVAEKVGYSDPAVFTRAFRSWTGSTPRQYREQTGLVGNS